MAELASCPWTYPNGSPVECVTEAEPLDVQPDVPLGWRCINRAGNLRGYRGPTGEIGISFAPGFAVRGLIEAKDRMFSFHAQRPDGFVELPIDDLDGVDVSIDLHRSSAIWHEPDLSVERMRPLWTTYDGQPWAVHEITTPNETYTYQFNVGNDYGSDEVFWSPVSLNVTGEDFELEIRWQTVVQASMWIPMHPIGADTCKREGSGALAWPFPPGGPVAG